MLLPCTAHDILEDIQDLFSYIRNDLNSALAEATGNPKLKIDTDAIGIAGTSAGGLCAYLCAIHISPKPRALLSMYGQGGECLVRTFSISKPENPISTFTEYRTTATWSQRRNRSSLINRWSTHPISPNSSSPNPRHYRLRRNLHWSTIRRLTQPQAYQPRNGCTSPDCSTNSANGWTISRAITRSARVFVNCDRRRHHYRGQCNLRRWILQRRER